MHICKECITEFFLIEVEMFRHVYEPIGYFVFTQLAFFWLVAIFARFALKRKPRKVPLILGAIWSIVPFINALLSFSLTSYMVNWQMAGYILICLTFSGENWKQLMTIWFFSECVSNVLSHLVGMLIGSMPFYGEILVSVAVMICFGVVFVSPWRHKLGDLLVTTPGWALIYAMVIMYIIIGLHQILVPGGAIQTTFIRMIEVFSENVMEVDPEYGQQMSQVYSVIILGIIDWMDFFYKRFYAVFLELLLCVAFVVYMVASRSNRILKQQNELFEKQIEAQAEHYRNLAEANAEVRRFRHDFKNLRFALEKLLSEGKKTEALAVMQEFGEALDSSKRFVMLFDTGNGIADALLTDKLHRAKESNTLISFEGAIPHSALLPTDLCVLLGNTIDNAIEACEKLPEEFARNITVECNCSSGFLFLTIRNPINKSVDIVDNRVNTTKKDNALHGFGISSLHKVAKKYDGTVKLDAKGGYFTVNVDLCLPAQALAS